MGSPCTLMTASYFYFVAEQSLKDHCKATTAGRGAQEVQGLHLPLVRSLI